MSLNCSKIKKDFPILGDGLVYLDNAATTQKPEQVVEKVERFYREENSNIGRGLYDLANTSTVAYSEARKTVSDFINSRNTEIVFVRNTTEAYNLLADSLEIEGDIVVPEMAHHSEQLPLRRKAEIEDRELNFIPTKNGKIDLEAAKKIIDKDTGLVSVSHVSNVFGKVNPVEELVELAHENNAYIVLDAAQSAPSRSLNVKELEVDFMTFSGHKMLGPTGIGVLYGKKKLLEEMKPYQVGGGMIRSVEEEETRWEEPPEKFEAGTPNIAGAIGLAEAIRYLEAIGMDSIREHEKKLVKMAEKELGKIEGVTLLAEDASSLVSFTTDFAHPHDVAEVLNQNNIAVRAGNHCAQPQMEKLGLNGTTRVSPYIYNTKEDVRKLAEAVKQVKKVFG